jgi:hypothetical protein
VVSAIPFLLALYFQLGFGWTAARSGLVVVALFFGNVAIKQATTPLMRRFGIRSVMLGAGLGVAIGALFVSLGGRLASTLGLGPGADEPFRVAFVMLAVILALPAVEALMPPRTAGSTVTNRA